MVPLPVAEGAELPAQDDSRPTGSRTQAAPIAVVIEVDGLRRARSSEPRLAGHARHRGNRCCSGVLLFRQARSGGLAFALALFIAETGTLVAIRALIAAGASSRWQYIMPFALVLIPAFYVVFILTRLRLWGRAGFTWPREWRAPHLATPLVMTMALPMVGLSARGTVRLVTLVFVLQIVFMLIDVFMEEGTYRGIV